MFIPPTADSSVHRLKQRRICVLLLCLWTSTFIALWKLMNGGIQIQVFQPPNPKTVHINNSGYIHAHPNSSSIISVIDMGISDEEWIRLKKALDWDSPDEEITLDLSTSPVHSTFSIVGHNESLKVGEKIFVTIIARDHNKNLKQYGGDFFQAKLFNSELKASVYGEVVDHRNGTYSVALLLPWQGQAQVFVRLIHSSEVVQVLKKYRDSSFPRIHYYGYFEGPGPNGTRKSEVVECNLKWGEDGSWKKRNCCCEYQDVKTGTVWQCERPNKLSCDNRVYHSAGNMENPLNPFEKKLFTRKFTNVAITGDKQIINVLPSTAGIATTEKCRSGMTTPVPAGFYFKDIWKSLVCNTRYFSPSQMGECLKGKIVYLMGDSTTRQWLEYLERNVPGMKRMDLHTTNKCGPLMAVELKNNIIIHWRPNGVPLVSRTKVPVTDLHFISNDIDDIAGGRHVVVAFTLCAHLVFHPLTFYVHEVSRIRQAVLALLKRAPETTVIVKTGNTAGFKNIFQSDWLAMQLNTVMREMFRDIGVVYLDVWEMTSCHYLTENIHPGPVIIANEVDMFLSHICPT